MKPITTAEKRSLPRPAPAKGQCGGDVKAARRHRASVERFVESGRVEDAAREAEPKTPVEELELFNAERIGEARSKGEDPALERAPRKASDPVEPWPA